MKLTKATISRFRNILQVDDVPIEEAVTRLVGKNQSGKTAFLHALLRCRPGRPMRDYDLLKDYPAWRQKADERAGENLNHIEPAVLTFKITDKDKARITQRLGCYPLGSDELEVARNFDNKTRIDIEVDEAMFFDHLLISRKASAELLAKLGEGRTLHAVNASLAEVVKREEDGSALRVEAETLVAAVKEAVGDRSVAQLVQEAVTPLIPTFFYFDEYSELQYSTDIAHVLRAEDKDLSDSELTVRALLRLAGADEAYLGGAEYENRKREIENVSNELTLTMREYWTQNLELAAAPDVTADIQTVNNEQVVIPQDLKLRIRDDRHHLSLPIDQHSAGFRWFFSFLAAFSEYEHVQPAPIVLLDEPALNLHARAQKDFLRLICDKLGSRCQVIYTTHSPFMIETERLQDVRIVEDRGLEIGAVVSEEIFSTDPDTLFPLQGALGYDLAQNFLIGPMNLLVEGSSDLVYLETMSSHLEELGRAFLDPKWSINVAGGAELMPAFVSLLGTDLDLTVLIDARRGGHQRLQRLVEHRVLEQHRIVTVGRILNRPSADIEDLFDPGDYLRLVNGHFGSALDVADLPGSEQERMVRRVARAIGENDYNHGKPADHLLRNKVELLPQLSKATLTNFERLFEAINATIPSRRTFSTQSFAR